MAKLTFSRMCEMLRARENFSLARFGDGEWACILGDEGKNCDNHPYTKDLGLALATVLLRPQTYYIGQQPKATRDLGERIKEWIAHHGCKIDFCDADIIHDASKADRLDELFSAMQGRKKILIGGTHLANLAYENNMIYIPTPANYPAWRGWTTMYADLVDQVDKDAVVLYCASMASEILIDKAARDYGDTITQIDIGSAFDPMVGVCSRRYHAEIIEREFPCES